MRESNYTRINGIPPDDLCGAIKVVGKACREGKIVLRTNLQINYLNYHLPNIAGPKIFFDMITKEGFSVALALEKFIKMCTPEQKVYIVSLNEFEVEAEVK